MNMRKTDWNQSTLSKFPGSATLQAMKTDYPLKATLIGVIAPLLWATFPMLTALLGKFPPFQLIFLQMASAGGMSLGLWLVRRWPTRTLRTIPKGYWLLGVYGIFGFYTLHFSAYQAAPASQVYILISLWPMLMLLFSFLIFRQPPKPWHIGGVLAGFLGVLTLSYYKGFQGFVPAFWLGHLLALLCAIIWASYSVLSRLYKGVPVEAIGGCQIITAILALVAHLCFESTVAFTPSQYLIGVLMGVGPTGLGLYAWNYGTQHGDLRLLSLFSYTSPILATFLLWSFGLHH
jgi:drug/metabolite transporter (DMT)-like permease